ncbi:2OG-Fe(II) oxygenase [Achromobacter xylosoxidans]|uniref:2OG-Fe(II) oxygenase n=1 Tax=Alcaligenes xylosoxydans xylosoxydans TaxID=85698 RepID=UPI0022B91B54|nr:2OG-Fe(II) oxygenase [Achromobacter xylosoxidans]MCZ8384137.1 hypothetical protein [Achromobacter xylosoxidans]
MQLPAGVEIHDDWFTPDLLDRLTQASNWMPMYFLNRASRFETHSLDIHWYYPVAVTEEALFGRVEDQMEALEDPLDVLHKTWKMVAANIGGTLGLYECSVSANTFGTEGNPHFDFRNRTVAPAHLTVLIYCSPQWDVTWAGETLIFDEDGEISGGIMPRPGRVAILRGDPYHVGRSVSRICPSDRRVLVFKMWDETLLQTLVEAANIKRPVAQPG